MRAAFAVVILLGVPTLSVAQDDEPLPPRYGEKSRLKQYPQRTPKETLRSALAAREKGDYSYLVAHLLEPKFVDDAVTERAKLFEGAAELELTKLRDFQRANRSRIADEDLLPRDVKAFRAMVAAKARDQGFKQLVRDVSQKFLDDPQAVKDLTRLLRDGTFSDADAAATATHADVKNRTLYFKKIDGRWFIENRQVDEK